MAVSKVLILAALQEYAAQCSYVEKQTYGLERKP